MSTTSQFRLYAAVCALGLTSVVASVACAFAAIWSDGKVGSRLGGTAALLFFVGVVVAAFFGCCAGEVKEAAQRERKRAERAS